MEPLTITFYRFLIAAVLLGIWLGYKKSLAPICNLKNKTIWSRIFIAGLLLSINYGGYIFALKMMSPAGAQVLIQLAPILLILSGVFIFHEKFSAFQWAGFVTFIIGLILFFWNRITSLDTSNDQYGLGMLVMIFAAVAWAMYASIQKQLLVKLSSAQLIFLINAIGAILFFFVSDPELIFQLDSIELLLLVLCGINTLVAYGCFSEALEHWEASKISAMLTTTPLIAMVIIEAINLLTDFHIESEPLTLAVILGAVLVVTGAACTSLGQDVFQKNNV